MRTLLHAPFRLPQVWRSFDAVGELINLPQDHLISMFVAIGRPLEPARPRGGKLPVDEVIIENRF